MAVIVGAILDRIIEDRRIGGETGHRTAAKSWYRKAAPRGDANAEFNLWSCTPMPLGQMDSAAVSGRARRIVFFETDAD